MPRILRQTVEALQTFKGKEPSQTVRLPMRTVFPILWIRH